MHNKSTPATNRNTFLLLAIVWLLLWLVLGASWLNAFPWLRLVLAFYLFIAPGTALSFILAGNRFTLLTHFVSGLSLSFLFVGALGVVGRSLNLPFAFIRPVFILAGLITAGAMVVLLQKRRQLYRSKNYGVVTLILLACMVIAGVVISLLGRFSEDSFSYLAYLTNWQHADPLNFQLVYSSIPSLDSKRFWLAMMPMNLAFLSEISGLHGLLLIGHYLGPVLVAIAILAAYSLYEDLFRSEQLAIAALLLQFTFLAFLLRGPVQQLGQIFFFRMTEDKVFGAFILAPAFFLVVRVFLQSRTVRTGVFILLTGFSLALAHPVILAYSIFILGIYTTLVTIPKKDYLAVGMTLTLLGLIMLPMAPLRLVSPLDKKKPAFDLEAALESSLIGRRITFIEGTPFYGFNVKRIKILGLPGEDAASVLLSFFQWSYLWLLGLGFIWSLLNLKKQEGLAPFIVGSSLLVILCAVPYTGWLVGYFVSARMLWRSPWLLPIGCIGVVLIRDFFGLVWQKLRLDSRSKISYEQAAFAVVLILCTTLLGYFASSVYKGRWQGLGQLDDYKSRLERLSSLGDYLERNIETPSTFLVSNRRLMNYLPGLSSKAKVIFFRTVGNNDPYDKELQAYKLVFSPDPAVSLNKRIGLLRKYEVEYLLLDKPSLKDYYLRDSRFQVAHQFQRYWIIRFQETVP